MSATYSCPICGLHYTGKKAAGECYAWCSRHSSCKLSVARQSVEAKMARESR